MILKKLLSNIGVEKLGISKILMRNTRDSWKDISEEIIEELDTAGQTVEYLNQKPINEKPYFHMKNNENENRKKSGSWVSV